MIDEKDDIDCSNEHYHSVDDIWLSVVSLIE